MLRASKWDDMCSLGRLHVGFEVRRDVILWCGLVRFGKGHLLHFERFINGKKYKRFLARIAVSSALHNANEVIQEIMHAAFAELNCQCEMRALELSVSTFRRMCVMTEQRFRNFSEHFAVLRHVASIELGTLGSLQQIAIEGYAVRHASTAAILGSAPIHLKLRNHVMTY